MIVRAAIGLLLLAIFIMPALAQNVDQNITATGSNNVNPPTGCEGTWTGVCHNWYTGWSGTTQGHCELKIWAGECLPIQFGNGGTTCNEDFPRPCPCHEGGLRCECKLQFTKPCKWHEPGPEAAPVQNLTADCEANPNCHWVNGECLCIMQSPEQIECEKDPNCAWRDGRCICVMPEPVEPMPGPVPNPTPEPMPGPVPNPTPNG